MLKKVIMVVLSLMLLILAVSCGADAPVINDSTSAMDETVAAGVSGAPSALFPAQQNYLAGPLWGYIDSTGKFVIQPKFETALRFDENGLAVAGKNGSVGLIDRSGTYILKPTYSSIGVFSDGLSIATDKAGFRVIDTKGRALSETYPYISDYREGRATFEMELPGSNFRYGYLGEEGRKAIEPIYESAGPFNDGLAVVKEPNGPYLLIDKSGNTLNTLKYAYVMNESNGMIAYRKDQDGRFGYLDSKGNPAIPTTYLEVRDFQNGTAVVNAASDYGFNKFGLINKKGEYLIQPQYNDILQLGDGLVGLGAAIDPQNPFAGSRYALATTDGKVLTDFIFYGMEPFSGGAASVHNNAETYFIDHQGNKAESLPKTEGIGTLLLLDSLVYADLDQRPFYMDREGNVIYRPESTLSLKSGVKVTEEKFMPNRNYLVYYPQLDGLQDLKVQEKINTTLYDLWTNASIHPSDNLDYHYEGDFSIGFNRKDLVELEESAYDYPFGAAHGMPIMAYAHVDTRTGAFYQLGDLFRDGSDYVKKLSGIVGEQIKEHGEEMGVWADSYKGIREDQLYSIGEDALTLYFQPYEIAPYAAGFPAFKIPYGQITDILDTQGGFWKSYH